MEGGKEQNFWPGFVDALSNVVLVMIFVVVVFVVTLFYYSQKLTQFRTAKLIERQEQQVQEVLPPTSKSAVDRREEENRPDVSSVLQVNQTQSREIAELKGQIATLQAKLSANTTTLAGSTRTDASAPSKAIQVEKDKPSTVIDTLPGIVIDSPDQAITLHFDKDGVELGREATRTLESSMRGLAERIKGGQGKLVVTGVIGTVAYTEGRRRAYYRTMAVRNYLIDLGISPTNVVSRVVPGNESPAGDATVLIQYAKAR